LNTLIALNSWSFELGAGDRLKPELRTGSERVDGVGNSQSNALRSVRLP